MTRPPDPAFELYSPASRHLVVTSAGTMLDELRGELKRRRSFYPALVRKGDMTEDDMRHAIALLAEIIIDFDMPPARDPARFAWGDKLNALRREIMIRRNSLPRRIARGDITQEDADHRLGALEAAHEYYWHHGMAYGTEFVTAGDPVGTRERLRAEGERRTAWAKANGRGPAFLFPLGAEIHYPAGWSPDRWPDAVAAAA